MIYKKYFSDQVYSDLINRGYYNNVFQLPIFEKLTLNVAHTDTIKNKHKLIQSLLALEMLSGQKPVLIRSKKAISSFNLKKSVYIAAKVTLTGKQIFLFIEKLLNFYLFKIVDENKEILKNVNEKNNSISFVIKNLNNFIDFENDIDKFSTIKAIELTLTFKNSNKSRYFLKNFLYQISK